MVGFLLNYWVFFMACPRIVAGSTLMSPFIVSLASNSEQVFFEGIYMGLRYHTGSLALSALIVAIFRIVCRVAFTGKICRNVQVSHPRYSLFLHHD